MKTRKSWREKLADSKDFPQVEEITEKMSKRWGTGTVVIPAPVEVDGLIRRVPRGKLTTVNDIRAALAKKHGATIGCPICTGIFCSIAAHAAEEDDADGKTDITPYWRVLKVGGELNPKFPGGVAAQAKRLAKEGHVIDRGRRVPRVKDFEKRLQKL